MKIVVKVNSNKINQQDENQMKLYHYNKDKFYLKNVDEINRGFKRFAEAKICHISNIDAMSPRDLIMTEGMVVSSSDVYAIPIKEVYICQECERLHKIIDEDHQDDVPKSCIECGGSLVSHEYRPYNDFQYLILQDIFDNDKNQISASVMGDDAYYGKYKEGDYVHIVAKVDTLPKNKQNKVLLKIEEIKFKKITLLQELDEIILKPEAQESRSTKKYRQWRLNILGRDGLTCQKCNTYHEYLTELEAHHIYNFSSYPHLRYDIGNGITFCKKCHIKFHKIYSNENNNSSQVEEFLRHSPLY